MATPDPDQPTRLTGKKGDMKFEMWVEVEGEPIEVYGAAVMIMIFKRAGS